MGRTLNPEFAKVFNGRLRHGAVRGVGEDWLAHDVRQRAAAATTAALQQLLQHRRRPCSSADRSGSAARRW